MRTKLDITTEDAAIVYQNVTGNVADATAKAWEALVELQKLSRAVAGEYASSSIACDTQEDILFAMIVGNRRIRAAIDAVSSACSAAQRGVSREVAKWQRDCGSASVEAARARVDGRGAW